MTRVKKNLAGKIIIKKKTSLINNFYLMLLEI